MDAAKLLRLSILIRCEFQLKSTQNMSKGTLPERKLLGIRFLLLGVLAFVFLVISTVL